jgi:hypothetical protein
VPCIFLLTQPVTHESSIDTGSIKTQRKENRMALYRVDAYVTVSCWTLVEAESHQEALEKAKNRELATAHIEPAESDREAWHVALDGSPTDLFIESD